MYRKEVKLKREGDLPLWKTGTANAARLELEETRSSHGDEKLYYAHQKEAEKGIWCEIIAKSLCNGGVLQTKKDYVYQFSTLRAGDLPLVLRGGYQLSISREDNKWFVTRSSPNIETVTNQ